MPGKKNASLKNPDMYEELREDGASKEKAARISNATAQKGRSESSVGRKGGKSGSYEDMTKQELYDRAKRVGIDGRSSMSKPQLIRALRNH